MAIASTSSPLGLFPDRQQPRLYDRAVEVRLRVKDVDFVRRDLIEGGYDIRTVQKLLGHTDVRTTMIYTHVLNQGGRGVRSPADFDLPGAE